MVGRLIQVAKSAYQYPLIFKQLLHTPLLRRIRRSSIAIPGVLPIVKLAIASAASHRPSAKSGSVRATRLAFSIGTATGFSRLSSRFQ